MVPYSLLMHPSSCQSRITVTQKYLSYLFGSSLRERSWNIQPQCSYFCQSIRPPLRLPSFTLSRRPSIVPSNHAFEISRLSCFSSTLVLKEKYSICDSVSAWLLPTSGKFCRHVYLKFRLGLLYLPTQVLTSVVADCTVVRPALLTVSNFSLNLKISGKKDGCWLGVDLSIVSNGKWLSSIIQSFRVDPLFNP